MTRSRRFLTTIAIAAFAAFWIAPHAHAYIDGGTASMLFQMLAAGLFASAFFVRTWWANLKSFVARLTGKSAPADAAAEESSTLDE